MLTIQLTPYRSVFKCREKSLKKERKIFIRISDADGYKNTRDFLIFNFYGYNSTRDQGFSFFVFSFFFFQPSAHRLIVIMLVAKEKSISNITLFTKLWK